MNISGKQYTTDKPIKLHADWDCPHDDCEASFLTVYGFKHVTSNRPEDQILTAVRCSNGTECPTTFCFGKYKGKCKVCSMNVGEVIFLFEYILKNLKDNTFFFSFFQKTLLALHSSQQWVHAKCVNSSTLMLTCTRCALSIIDPNDLEVCINKQGKECKYHRKCVPKKKRNADCDGAANSIRPVLPEVGVLNLSVSSGVKKAKHEK